MAALQLKPLTLFVDPSVALVDARLRDILSYWKEQRGDNQIPSRAQIAPADLVTHLPRLALLNVANNGQSVEDYSVRLSGTGIDDLLGHDHRGAGLNDLLPPASAKLVAAALAALVQHKRPMRFYAHARLPGNPDAQVEGIALPLGPSGEAEDGAVNMVLLETVSIRQSDKANFPELQFDGLDAVAS
jgi:hypothetical protein